MPAVFDCAVRAGAIASSIGSAIVAPNAPRRKVRRDRCFFVMIICLLHSWAVDRPYGCRSGHSVAGLSGFQARPHLERLAFDNSVDDGAEAVAILSRLPDDAAYDRHIGRFEAPS